MWERLTVLGFSVLMIFGSLGLAGWLLGTGQVVGVEALFVLFTSLVFAGVGALGLWLLMKSGGKSGSGRASTAGA